MDLGATVCHARTPRCDVCPIAALCRSRGRATPPAPRRQAAFATSDRRVRGRIIAALRDAPRGLEPSELRRAIGDRRVARLTMTLQREGLAIQRMGRVRLPE
jgi:A/G-specific adenine glycosylase